jgi:hypothetical protein
MFTFSILLLFDEIFLSDGEYKVSIPVPHGCHYYRILVNGRQRFIASEVSSNENLL